MKYSEFYPSKYQEEIDYVYYNHQDLLIFDNVITFYCLQDLRIILKSGCLLRYSYKGNTFISKYLIDLEQFNYNIEII